MIKTASLETLQITEGCSNLWQERNKKAKSMELSRSIVYWFMIWTLSWIWAYVAPLPGRNGKQASPFMQSGPWSNYWVLTRLMESGVTLLQLQGLMFEGGQDRSGHKSALKQWNKQVSSWNRARLGLERPSKPVIKTKKNSYVFLGLRFAIVHS